MGCEAVNLLKGGSGNDSFAGLAGADTLIGGDGADTADYSASDAGVQVQLGATGTGGGVGGHANGDQLIAMESITGSAFHDLLLGSTAANKLISGAGNDTLAGGSGNDIISATGTGAASGQKQLYGDGISDGGTAGADIFRILGGTNFIRDYQPGIDDVYVNSLTASPGLTSGLSIGGVAHWAVVLTGATHQSFVVLGTTASLTAAQAGSLASFFVANDLFLDPGLIA
jgi:Ca2+-binding RTX toxin-like protein